MKKHIISFLSVIIIVSLAVFGYIYKASHIYRIYFSYFEDEDCGVIVNPEDASVIEVKAVETEGRRGCIELSGKKAGKTNITLQYVDEAGRPTGNSETIYDIVVTKNRCIYYVTRTNVNGWQSIVVGFAVIFTAFSVSTFLSFFKLQKNKVYDYKVIFTFFLFLMSLIFAGIFMFVSYISIKNNADITPYSVLGRVRSTFFFLDVLMMPFTIIFSVAIGVSNLSLIRHEGVKPVNMLGVFLGGILTLSAVLSVWLFVKLYSETEIIIATIINVFIFALIAGQVLLLAICICAFICLKKKHEYDMDYIIILGCGIRKDGSLYPLLKGRADKAISFYREQERETGKKLYLVPSGGKGSDEIMAEGEAIKNYLMEQGIPENQILAETESTTTMENMLFSKKLIDENIENAKGLYSTTNYHVFRAGLFAKKAGLDCGGIGSKTKWYFWPNAFLREMAGILTTYWKQVMILFVFLIAMALFMSNFTDMVNMIK